MFVGDISAFAQGKDVLSGRVGKAQYGSSYITSLTDGNLQTSDTLSNGEVIIDLASPVRVSGFRFTKVGGSSNRMDVYFYTEGATLKREYRNTDSGYLQAIDIKGVKKIGLKNMSNGDYFTLAEVNLYEYESVPPSDITDLKENIKHDSVEFTYKNPKSNFSHLRIYRDGQVLASDVKEEKFTDKGLTPETEH
ncbi:fibronectin type III domain-containing protein, partial [Bacillus thuringiensis]|nr:fibronectin type III domain-containing protein [Bacillus thuringiensis]